MQEKEELISNSLKELEESKDLKLQQSQLAQQLSLKDFQLQNSVCERETLEKVNRSLQEDLEQASKQLIEVQTQAKTELDAANQRIESLLFECNTGKGKLSEASQAAESLQRTADAQQAALQAQVASMSEEITTLKAQMDRIGKDEAYRQVLAQKQELADLYALAQTDLARVNEQLASTSQRYQETKQELDVLLQQTDVVHLLNSDTSASVPGEVVDQLRTYVRSLEQQLQQPSGNSTKSVAHAAVLCIPKLDAQTEGLLRMLLTVLGFSPEELKQLEAARKARHSK